MQKSPEFQKDSFLIRAPLATFDTIDLGDDLPNKSVHQNVSVRGCNKEIIEETNITVKNENDNCCIKEEEEPKPEAVKLEKPSPKREFFKFDKRKDAIKKDSPKPDKRKGSPKKDKSKVSSKKESSKSEKKKDKDNKKVKSNSKQPVKEVSSSVQQEDVNVLQNKCNENQACASCDYEKETDNYVYIRHEPYPGNVSGNLSEISSEGRKVETVFIPPPPKPNQDIPQLQRTASFSSSDSESDFEISQGKKTQPVQKSFAKENEHVSDKPSHPVQSPLTLSPELVDPSTITSPSKRKAYENRLRRQQVKTSPIARPRSTTPISVVTLDEYTSVLSSPENSPLSPTLHLGEKLKITLPPDEFSIKSKPLRTERNVSVSSDESESVFEFNEEILFSRTRSALVVDETGIIPSSPRRVLIPPTISPSTHPKIAEVNAPIEGKEKIPKLLYFQTEIEVSEAENWAVFPEENLNPEDSSVTDGKSSCQVLPRPIYAKEEHEIPLEEDILTVNISSISPSGGHEIDIVLSSSSSHSSQLSSSSAARSVSDNPDTNTEHPPPTEVSQASVTEISEASIPEVSEELIFEVSQSSVAEVSQASVFEVSQSSIAEISQPSATEFSQPSAREEALSSDEDLM